MTVSFPSFGIVDVFYLYAGALTFCASSRRFIVRCLCVVSTLKAIPMSLLSTF